MRSLWMAFRQRYICLPVVLVVGLVDVGGAQTGCVGGGPYWGEVRVVLGVVAELLVVIGLVVGEDGFVVVFLVDMVVDVVEVVDVDVAGVVDVVFLDGVTVVVVVVTVVELTVGVNRVVVVVAVVVPCDVVAVVVADVGYDV